MFRQVPTPLIPLGGHEEPFLNEPSIVPVVEGGLVARQVLLNRGE